ncbi:MarR family transcriptional regulator [Martelella alba]|uniref:MarR family transcriptional regulator n=1 Tax=Martelella alba TaxID=2590451 RepID=A0A506UGW3_9HYPH|nr:MarR family transcriptional regulator [Martelella alba]TPW31487.1 MarR family transcriptional regulator [Martelella alba]
MADLVKELGYLTLGTRLRRLGERLQAETQRIMDEAGLTIQAAQFPYLAALDRDGPLSVGDLAALLGISQPGVTRTLSQLARQGLVETVISKEDQRRRVVALSDEGRALVAFSRDQVWPKVEAAVRGLCRDLDGSLLDQLAGLEQGLDGISLVRRAATWGQQ